jgi:ParB family chromosome partitioning protein
VEKLETKGQADRLGKGLGALLGEYTDESVLGKAPRLQVSDIVPNTRQPRREFSESSLEELASSISENGLLQPLLVRPHPKNLGKYELVAGERRVRAIKSLGWTEVPAIRKEVADENLLVLALVENIQRQDLGAIEEAEAYRVLAEDVGMNHSEIAKAVGKARTTVVNSLRLLGLTPAIKAYLETGELTAGHARALLVASSPAKGAALAGRAVREGWSVRRTEKEAKGGEGKVLGEHKAQRKNVASPVVQAFQEELRGALETRVKVSVLGKSSGVIEVPFYSEKDFDRLFLLLTGKETEDVVS